MPIVPSEYVVFAIYLIVSIILRLHSCHPVESTSKSTGLQVSDKPSSVTPPEIVCVQLWQCMPNFSIDSSHSLCIEQLDFMRKFGYLESGSSTSEALYHEDAVIAAIKNVQKYGALNESGILDNDTLKVPLSPVNNLPTEMSVC